MVAAIGQRIDSPVALALIEAIGAKPLKPATPTKELPPPRPSHSE
jgi:hypothetical protein